MKRLIPCILLTICTLTASAQATYLSQNFDASCISASGFPLDWSSFNPIPATIPNGQWTCAPSQGQWLTPGMKCTSVWGTPSAYHLDTSYLVSPALDLSAYTGSIYLHFDSKTTNINLAGRLSLIVSSDSITFDTLGGSTFSDRTSSLSPTFGNGDSTDWVTHIADLTPFQSTHPLYVAFRYTSDNTIGSTWYIDNIFTTTFPAKVTDPDKNAVSMKIIGNSSSSQVTLSCKTGSPGLYHLGIYDMLGREMYKGNVSLTDSEAANTISGLTLAPGMYLIKMSNGVAYGTVKTVVY